MRLPWSKRLEFRGSEYTDAITSAILSSAQGKTLAIPTATAALEACAGSVGRAFAAAEVKGQPMVTEPLTPAFMETIGRSLLRHGEIVFLISTTSGRLRLFPAEAYDIEGGPDPETWEYRITLAGPSHYLTHDHTPAASVIHIRYANDASRPWRGHSPLDVASLAGKLSSETVNALADESSGPIGRLLGIPKDGDDVTIEPLKRAIENARGRVALVESGDWGSAGGDATMNPESKRFGADPPAALVALQDTASREVYAACGFNPSLFQVGPAAALREAWRIALFGVVSPLGKLVQAELSEKLNDDVTIGWTEMRASDLSGRARAFQSLVGSGLSIQAAAKEAGIEHTEEAPKPTMVEGEE